MANVHIALVGGQTYPVYLGIAEQLATTKFGSEATAKPDKVVLVHSASSHAEAQRIAAEFSSTGIPFIYEQCDPVNVKQVLDKSRMMAETMSDDDHYTLNLTSGTKVWSIVFHEAFEKKPHVRFIYVDQSCVLYDLSTGESRQGDHVDTDRVFRLNGTETLRYFNFNDFTDNDLQVLKKIQWLYNASHGAFTALTVASTADHQQMFNRTSGEYEKQGSSIEWDRNKNTIALRIKPRFGNMKSARLSSPHIFDLVLNAGWFEAEVARHLSKWEHSREVRMNVEFPYKEGNPKNEIDVIVNTGTRLLFVECKTSIRNLTDLDKFSKAVHNYGGTGCHALFVSYTSMSSEAIQKCRDNGVIPFSFRDALKAAHGNSQPDVITNALHRLLNERLFIINKK